MRFEPLADGGRLVGGHIVEDDVQLVVWIRSLDASQKCEESAPVWRA
jgi:hypothetical protein